MKKKCRLWKRDYDILNSLEQGILSSGQLARLYFNGNRKKCAERMKLLFCTKLVSRFQKPLLDVRGKPEYIYCKKGKTICGYSKINHELGVSEFKVLLYQALKEYSGLSCRFISRVQIFQLFSGLLVPDGIFVLEKDRKRLLYFLEVDFGSENLVSNTAYSLLLKLRVYANYFDSGKYNSDFKSTEYAFKGFRVVVVFATKGRLSNFLKIAIKENFDFVLSAYLKELNGFNLKDRVWLAIDGAKENIFGK